MKKGLLLLLLTAAVAADSCSFSIGKLYPLASIRQCVLQVPVRNQTLKEQTLDSVEKTLALYAFRDIVKSPPDSPLYVTPVDIHQRLLALRETPLISDWELLQGINAIFTDLKDPHTVFTKPRSCYYFQMMLPFQLSSRLNSAGQQELYVYGVANWAQPQYESLVSLTVESIDGMPAMDAIRRFSEQHQFISKDYATAFNAAVNGAFTSRIGLIYDFPETTLTNSSWKINGSLYNLQWQAAVGSSMTIDAKSCMSPAALRRARAAPREPIDPMNFNPLKELDSMSVTPVAQVPDIEWNVSSLNGDSAITLRIRSFGPPSESSFMATLKEAISAGESKNVKNLIIDLRGNGGGSISLGNDVFRSLVRELHRDGTYDMMQSPLADTFVSLAAQKGAQPTIWSPQQFQKINSGEPYTTPAWYYGDGDHHYRTRGGVTAAYTDPVSLNFDPVAPVSDYFFEKIIVVSDGMCGSTCAVFSSHLQKSAADNKIATVTMGGIKGRVQQLWSFPGGLVYRQSALISDAQSLGVPTQNPFFPTEFPFGSSASFAMLEVYRWNQQDYSLPLEYEFSASNYHLDFWAPDDSTSEQLYQQVLPIFKQL